MENQAVEHLSFINNKLSDTDILYYVLMAYWYIVAIFYTYFYTRQQKRNKL